MMIFPVQPNTFVITFINKQCDGGIMHKFEQNKKITHLLQYITIIFVIDNSWIALIYMDSVCGVSL